MTERHARRRRGLSVALAVLAAIGLLLTACGDDDTSPEDEARADGEALGESIAALGAIQVEAGLTELETTITGFSETNDSIAEAAWEGVETGLESEPE